jgi:hypothetical protein
MKGVTKVSPEMTLGNGCPKPKLYNIYHGDCVPRFLQKVGFIGTATSGQEIEKQRQTMRKSFGTLHEHLARVKPEFNNP